MNVGILKLEFFIPMCESLKDKRMFLSSVKKKLRQRFNISLIEFCYKDKWQRAGISIANLGEDKRAVNRELSHIINFLEENYSSNLINHGIEIL